MLFIFFLSFLALLAFYFYVKKCNNYWKERGVKTVNTNFLFGTSFDVFLGRRSIQQVNEDIYEKAKPEPYVGVYNLLKPMMFIRDPQLINQITVKDFSHFYKRRNAGLGGGRLSYSVADLDGEEWKTVRNTLIPTFSSSKLRNMYDLMEECSKMLVEQYFR